VGDLVHGEKRKGGWDVGRRRRKRREKLGPSFVVVFIVYPLLSAPLSSLSPLGPRPSMNPNVFTSHPSASFLR
jgi:hypothetical protein